MTTTKRENRGAAGGSAALIDDEVIERLMAQVAADGIELLGPNGLLTGLTKRVMERALEVERTEHLGYERGDPAGRGSGNSRNGTSAKTLLTDAGAIPLDIPRDRDGTFEPVLVPKHERRLDGFNEMVCSLVSKGLSVRDTVAHLYATYGVEISPEMISKSPTR